MTTVLADFVAARNRFSRSANIERDHGRGAIEGYVPTGRALDVISRIANGLAEPAAGRTFSITGPHGGGKSSLAVFLDGLLAGTATAEFKSAHSILDSTDPSAGARLRSGMRAVKSGRNGFIRAFATAQREPVAKTIARALHRGAVRHFGHGQSVVPASFTSNKRAPAAGDIRACIQRLCADKPILLVVDEFGKNLEYFASSGTDGDPFLLQELAEMTQGENAAPLVIITMQHLSFDEYIQDSSTTRRREWSKVQGRFQDIPYVETAAQSRRLIASALEQHPSLRIAGEAWVSKHRTTLESLGLRDLIDDSAVTVPLHPLALAVLPDLCSRYGQNERTLFSFLTGAEPSAFPHYLRITAWHPCETPHLAGLDLLYDYFLESSGSMIGVADGASRWMEIETRIRDNAGLTPEQLRAVKTIGVLNLVSSGGRIRASRSLLELALATTDSDQSPRDSIDLEPLLASLTEAGLITYRAFSDEYRIWQGSDYNLRRVIENARHTYEDAELVDLLRDAASLEPVVAGRHSQSVGVLRVFARQFSSLRADSSEPLEPEWDGVVYYSTNRHADLNQAPQPADGRPAVFVMPDNVSAVRDAAIDAASLSSALRTAELEGADWVATRELIERAAGAQHKLQAEIGRCWDVRAEWILASSGTLLNAGRGLSALLSEVSDTAYPDTPHIANEMIARRELTSQGAKARRFLIDALLAHRDEDAFSIEGYGPDRAIYEAVFRSTGIHRLSDTGEWTINPPTDRRWKPVWTVMNSAFDRAVETRLNLDDIRSQLRRPPVGLKDGIVPLLIITGLVARSDEIALYEHGSLVLSIDDAVAERLTKNPGHFSIKYTQTRSGRRRLVLDSLIKRLGITSRASSPTFLNVATALYRELRVLPPYSQKTKLGLSPEAIAVREAFHEAAEPDLLIFETLPVIFGLDPIVGRARLDSRTTERFAEQLASSILELRNAYPQLVSFVQQQLAQATSTGGSLRELRQALTADATRLEGNVLEPRLKAFVGALTRPIEDQPWLENVAMVVCEGQAPRVWTDDIAARFPLRVTELGGALRRTLALMHERLASNLKHGYSSSRMTLTRPDGTESIELLVLTEPEKASIDPHFERLLATVMEGGLSRSAACRMLMARLASEHESTESPAMTQTFSREDKQYG